VCSAGKNYYIVWRDFWTSGSYNWILKEEDFQPGENCSTAIEAVVDTNKADNSIDDQWFKYIAKNKSKITISACDLTTEDTYVIVYKDCEGTKVALNDDFCGSQSKVSFNADTGEVYYIVWKNFFTSKSFNWILSALIIDAGHDTSICAGDQITLKAKYNKGTVIWDNGIQDNIAFIPNETKIYTATLINNYDTISDQIIVTVKPIPIINAGKDTAICNGNAIILKASYNEGVLNWNNGITDGIAFTPSETKTYIAEVTNKNCKAKDEVTITVNPKPIIDITKTAQENYFLLDAGNGYSSYIWTPGNETTKSIIVSQSGVYSVTVSNDFGCKASASIEIDISNSINNYLFDDIKIYPNPFKDFINIEIPGSVKLEIVNSTGNIILEKSISGSEKVNTDFLKPGIYILKIFQNTENKFVSFIITKI
jgi:hypothetical protein